MTPDVTLRTQVRPISVHDPADAPAVPARLAHPADPEEVDFSPWDPKAWREWCARLVPPPARAG